MVNYNQNYGYGYPYGVNYQIPYQQPNYNNMGNVVQNQNQQQPQITQCFWVNNVEGAKSFQMMPNQTAMLMDSENPVVYMKQTNAMGQATLKYFKLIETSEQEIRGQNQQPASNQQPNVEYALKSDFEGLSKRIDEISKKIEKPFKNDKNTDKGGNQ